MSNLDQLEHQYIDAHKELYDVARKATNAKKCLMEAYVELHHPGVYCHITIMEDNMLSLDVVFPGLENNAARRLGQELCDYLQRLP